MKKDSTKLDRVQGFIPRGITAKTKEHYLRRHEGHAGSDNPGSRTQIGWKRPTDFIVLVDGSLIARGII